MVELQAARQSQRARQVSRFSLGQSTVPKPVSLANHEREQQDIG